MSPLAFGQHNKDQLRRGLVDILLLGKLHKPLSYSLSLSGCEMAISFTCNDDLETDRAILSTPLSVTTGIVSPYNVFHQE